MKDLSKLTQLFDVAKRVGCMKEHSNGVRGPSKYIYPGGSRFPVHSSNRILYDQELQFHFSCKAQSDVGDITLFSSTI